MKRVGKLLAVAALPVIVMVAFIWSGVYNIAATKPHSNLTTWLLAKARDRSIAFHSKEITLPPMTDPKFIDVGFHHYHPMCRLCHGAPGYSPAEFADGLYPRPPLLLSEDLQRRPDAELYWIIRNGIKMTGMPSFGMTHDCEELLALLAFLRRVPRLTALLFGTNRWHRLTTSRISSAPIRSPTERMAPLKWGERRS